MMSTQKKPAVTLQGVEILFLDHNEDMVKEWNQTFDKYVPEKLKEKIQKRRCALEFLQGGDATFDCIVSPANSYGLMDKGFNWFLSDELAGNTNTAANAIVAMTHHIQAALYRQSRGFITPGTCTLVPCAGSSFEGNKHGCKFIAVCPIMRTSRNTHWDKEIVYECTWMLLNAIDTHNASCAEGDKIKKVLCPGLATGAGQVSAKKCAAQMALAFKHYDEAVRDRDMWKTWDSISVINDELAKTHDL